MGTGLALVVYLRTVGDGRVAYGAGTTGSIGTNGSGWYEQGRRASDRAEMKSYVLLWFWPWLCC